MSTMLFQDITVMVIGLYLLAICQHVILETRHFSSRVVTTRYGALRGFITTLTNRQLQPVEVFLGVPYAGSPTGPLRFMPPVTSPHWRGIRLADQFGAVCPQRLPDISNETQVFRKMPAGRFSYLTRILPFLQNQSEDCLYLNIYAPAVVGREPVKLPVMVFIHGESYEWNSGNPYDGSVLASFGHVVVVTINYRLGILGFLPPVDGSARGNYGLMDQVAALHWIQENIAEFGGDSNNVTIFGQSYGAACVNLLMLSPMAKGLFHRAIMQSGSALSPWAIARDALTYTLHVARILKCPVHDNMALVDCMRKKPLADIMGVELVVPDHLTAFGPTIDGIVLPQEPAVLMERYNDLYVNYDLMFGVTRMESYFHFSAMEERIGIDPSRRDRLLRTLVRNLFSFHLQEIFFTIVNEYMDWSRPMLQPTDIFDGTAEAIGDALIVAPLIRVGNLHSSSVQMRTFFYVFGHQSESGDYTPRLGCVHGDDLPYIFGAPLVGNLAHFHRNYTRSEVVLSEVVMTHWSNFAKVGDPNKISQEIEILGDNLKGRFDKSTWPAYDPVHQKYFSIATKPKIRDHYHAHRLSYWLHLIPRLHRSGNVNVSAQHHLLQEHDNPYSYDGIVKQDSLEDLQLPKSYASAPSSVTSTRFAPSRTSAPLYEFSEMINTSDTLDTTTSSFYQESSSEGPTSMTNASETLHLTIHNGIYSTALSVTIAVGCSLLILNVLIFTGVCYRRDKHNLEDKLQKALYQARTSGERDPLPQDAQKSFILKETPSLMNPYGPSPDCLAPSQTQTLNMLPQKIPLPNNLKSPPIDALPEAQPLLAHNETTVWSQDTTQFEADVRT